MAGSSKEPRALTAETPALILGVILAGGASRRFGVDKARALLGGVPLIERVAARARPQVDRLAVSVGAPRALDTELPAIVDDAPGQGPLGGVVASLGWAAERGFALVATFPCDAPFFPLDLVAGLRRALTDEADCAMARRGAIGHFAFALWRTRSEPLLRRALAEGARSLRSTGRVARCVFADFALETDAPGGDAFFNINRPEDLALASAWLDRKSSLD